MNDAPAIGEILIGGCELLVAALALIEVLEQERDRFRAALVIVHNDLKPVAAGQWMITAESVKKVVEALEGER